MALGHVLLLANQWWYVQHLAPLLGYVLGEICVSAQNSSDLSLTLLQYRMQFKRVQHPRVAPCLNSGWTWHLSGAIDKSNLGIICRSDQTPTAFGDKAESCWKPIQHLILRPFPIDASYLQRLNLNGRFSKGVFEHFFVMALAVGLILKGRVTDGATSSCCRQYLRKDSRECVGKA